MADKFVVDGKDLEYVSVRLRQAKALFDILEVQPGVGLNASLMCQIGRDLAASAHQTVEDMRGGQESGAHHE
ncbi:hypothetical protein [Burkholderia gladioli]|uniref:hypothetical protein n=1 Tax=Burkholderia gladioli TaxID=28095 RepID=UPI001C5E1F42|nr:hypothetical protein [Burkholderia gladioli]MBW5285306.1 hypothetical protein [Burkholderia gladioli]